MTLVYVDDVAAGHLAAFDRGRPGERYILADGFATDRARSSRAAVEAAGRGRVPPTMPAPLARGPGARRRGGLAGDPPPAAARGRPAHFLLWEARADSTKAREELGIEFTPWRDGHRAHGRVDDRVAAGSEAMRAPAAGRSRPAPARVETRPRPAERRFT